MCPAWLPGKKSPTWGKFRCSAWTYAVRTLTPLERAHVNTQTIKRYANRLEVATIDVVAQWEEVPPSVLFHVLD